jgi:hypothetical protein
MAMVIDSKAGELSFRRALFLAMVIDYKAGEILKMWSSIFDAQANYIK